MTGDLVASTVVDGLPTFVCGPCSTPGGGSCCLYPPMDLHGNFGGPFYPATDLPDQLFVTYFLGGVTATVNRVGYTYPIGDIGADGGDWTLQPADEVLATEEDDAWLTTNSGVIVTGQRCLTDGNAVFPHIQDLFLDNYTVNALDTITRTTPCIWSGAKTGGGVWTLDYGLTTPYKWHLGSTGASPTSDNKTPPQASPAGTYGLATIT